MAKLQWTVLLGATDITSKVASFNITQGRTSYLDNYGGGSLTLTLYNAADYVETNIQYGSKITVYSGTAPNYGYYLAFWVQGIAFHDEVYGVSTATITCADWLSRVGRLNTQGLSLSQTGTGIQFRAFTSAYGGPIPSDLGYSYTSVGSSTASATTYTGSPLNYLNYLVNTERGVVFINNNTLIFVTRTAVGATPGTYTLGDTSSATQVAYTGLDRIQNGLNFINQATIEPQGLASQTVVDSTSVATYGAASYSAATVDATTTQAADNASWIVNNFGSPYYYRFEVMLNDSAQTSAALTGWLSQMAGQTVGVGYGVTNLIYPNVGGSGSTTTPVIAEGWDANVTPEATQFRFKFSPLSYYQYLLLDSTTVGILDTNRMGW